MTMTARSIVFGTSKTLLYAFLENTVSLEGLMGYTTPLNPFIMFAVMVDPTLPCLSEAPITAIDFGDKNTDSATMLALAIFL